MFSREKKITVCRKPTLCYSRNVVVEKTPAYIVGRAQVWITAHSLLHLAQRVEKKRRKESVGGGRRSSNWTSSVPLQMEATDNIAEERTDRFLEEPVLSSLLSIFSLTKDTHKLAFLMEGGGEERRERERELIRRRQ